MKLFLSLFLSMLLLSGSVTRADTLSGVLYGGPTQTHVVCYLFNAGPGNVSVTAKTIADESAEITQYGTSCGTTLGVGKTCWFGAYIVNNRAHSCRAVLSPSGDNVRGSIDVRDVDMKVLVQSQLR
jgi:hypothetical protein